MKDITEATGPEVIITANFVADKWLGSLPEHDESVDPAIRRAVVYGFEARHETRFIDDSPVNPTNNT